MNLNRQSAMLPRNQERLSCGNLTGELKPLNYYFLR